MALDGSSGSQRVTELHAGQSFVIDVRASNSLSTRFSGSLVTFVLVEPVNRSRSRMIIDSTRAARVPARRDVSGQLRYTLPERFANRFRGCGLRFGQSLLRRNGTLESQSICDAVIVP